MRRHTRTTLLTVPLLMAVAVAGCAQSSPESATASPGTDAAAGADSSTTAADAQTRSVEHGMGTTQVPAEVKRVVVLDTGELDAVVSLGVVPVGAVTTDVSTSLVQYLEPELAEVESVGTIGEPNLEAIAALRPDLILSNTVRHEDLYDELSAVAPTVFADDVGDTWKETLLLAGEALDEQEQAEELIADYESRATEVGLAVTDGDPGSVEVSVVRFLPGQIRLYTPSSFIGTILEDAGFTRPASQLEGDTFVEASAEQLALADGDVVFTAVYGDPADTDQADVVAGPVWQNLGAVQRGDVQEVSDDTWMLGIGVTAANLVLDDLEQYLGRG